VQKWQISDLLSSEIEKSKHVVIEFGGPSPASLHFSVGSKETAEEIHAKLRSSKALAAPAETGTKTNGSASPPPEDHKRKNGASVHFAETAPVEIPPREPSIDEEHTIIGEGERAIVLYDFIADGEDELSVNEGEHLLVLEKDGDDWWKVRNVHGSEGVVPASYVEVSPYTLTHSERKF
jgi:actin cytoskeleton-regulatory complex protein SLA1